MEYQFGRVNHSVRGSFLAVENTGNKIRINTARNGGSEVFCIVFDEEYEASFTEWEVSVKTAFSNVKIRLSGTDDLYVKGTGKGFLIEHKEYTERYIANFVLEEENRLIINNFANDTFEQFTANKGRMIVDAPRTKESIKHDYINIYVEGDSFGEFELLIEQFFSPSIYEKSNIPCDECAEKNKNDYLQWEKKFEVENDADREAVYILWSNICSPGGNYKDDTILMSNSGMPAVWSWDNCFNALGIAIADPQLALKQFLFPYQYMDENGCIPDCVSESNIVRNFVKPPVQGWIYNKLAEYNSFFKNIDVIKKIYPLMKENTLWWLNFRGDVPYYCHGNDSGADNATCFDEYSCIETGELSAFLAVQCEVLADMAHKQGILDEQVMFEKYSSKLLKISLNDYFDGNLFVKDKRDKKTIYSAALLLYRVIVLEGRLTDKLKKHIVSSLKAHYITENGIASEAIDSNCFEEDGYWRGAVWAPDQVIFLLSLNAIGECQLAKNVAKKYIDSLSNAGFYENISAVNGRGLRVAGHTWTAAAYIALKQFLEK